MRATSSACMCRCRSSKRSITSCRIACWPKARARCGRSRSRARMPTARRSRARCSTTRAAWARGRPRAAPRATCYPTGVAAVPVEVLEASMPIVFDKKELRVGSGGAGASRGGDGQTIGWRMRTNDTWLLNAVASRTGLAPEGLAGGASGAAGRFLVNGKTGHGSAKDADAAAGPGDSRDAGRRRLRLSVALLSGCSVAVR